MNISMATIFTQGYRNLLNHLTWVIVPVLIFVCYAGTDVLCVAEEELPKAEEILDKYVEAIGGKEAYDKIKNRVSKSTLEMVDQGVKMSLTIYGEKPNKMYSLMESEMIGKFEKGCDGKEVWEISAMMGPVLKEGKEKAEGLRDATFDRLVYWNKVYEKAECVALENVEEKPCYKVVMTPKQLEPGKEEEKIQPQTCYFDQKSHLMIKMEAMVESPMGTMPMAFFLSDYKKVDGILLHHKVQMKVMGMERVITTESIKHNVDLPPDRFKLPEEIQKLVDERKGEGKDIGEPQMGGEESKSG